MSKERICAIILAAGSGTRLAADKTKQQIAINGKSILAHTLTAFEKCDDVTDVIVVVKAGEERFAEKETKSGFSKIRKIVLGGKTRAESAANGFFAIDFLADFVAIHDAARCLILPEDISRVVSDAKRYGAASAAAPVVDTVKRVDNLGFAVKTENRDELKFATTPQIFKSELYAKALKNVDLSSLDITDDNVLMERIGVNVYMTDIGKRNIKITYASDLSYARFLMENENV